MPSRHYRTFALHEALVAHVDKFLEENRVGYRSRSEVIAAAVREFLERRLPKGSLRAEAKARDRSQ